MSSSYLPTSPPVVHLYFSLSPPHSLTILSSVREGSSLLLIEHDDVNGEIDV